MKQKNWILDEIEVDVSGLFTTHHHLQAGTGIIGKFKFPAFSQGAVYHTADGRELLMQKTHWLGTAHELVDGQTVRGTADRPGLLRSDLLVKLDGQEYTLEPQGIFKQGWYLLDKENNVLMEIQPRGVFRQGAYLTPTGVVEADLVAFAYYLVHMRQQEDAAAVSATTAS